MLGLHSGDSTLFRARETKVSNPIRSLHSSFSLSIFSARIDLSKQELNVGAAFLSAAFTTQQMNLALAIAHAESLLSPRVFRKFR